MDSLKEIYYIDNDITFRHSYSSLFGTIVSLFDSNNEQIEYFETLTSKFLFLLTYYEQKSNDTTSSFFHALRKLYDHINLDVSRLRYNESHIKKQIESLKSETVNIKKEKEQLKQNIDKLQELSQKTKKELKSSKTDYITLLGIFASIIMACFGSMTFSTSVLNNINTVSIYRLIVIALIIGLVFVNIISILTVFITKLHDKKIKTINIVTIIFNIMIILGLTITFILYKFKIL